VCVFYRHELTMRLTECESGLDVGIDEAIIAVSSALSQAVSVWSHSDECSQVCHRL